MKSIKDVKSAVKTLRKELSALGHPSGALSHTEALELLSRVMGHKSWGAMRVTLADESTAKTAPRGTDTSGANGFQPLDESDPAVGPLPTYQFKGLLASLEYHPDIDSKRLYLMLVELDAEGGSMEGCDTGFICHLPAVADTPSKTTAAHRSEFVKLMAELVQPYLSKDLGLRAVGAALRGSLGGTADDEGLKQSLEALRASIAVRGTLASRDEVPVGESGMLVTLDNEEIIGTLEQLSGHARISSALRSPNGTIALEYEGETVIWWDNGKTMHNEAGETLYVTASYSIVPESLVKLAEA